MKKRMIVKIESCNIEQAPNIVKTLSKSFTEYEVIITDFDLKTISIEQLQELLKTSLNNKK